MITEEEKAIEFFNSALKSLINKDTELNKLEAKEIALNQIVKIKEALGFLTVLDKIPVNCMKKTYSYYFKVQNIIELL
jgi:hypothetical protein